MSLLLKNGTFLNIATLEFNAADILVEQGSGGLKFSTDGEFSQQELENAVVEDCTGKYIMHSFADGYQRPCLSLSFAASNFEQPQPTYFRYVTNLLWSIDSVLDYDLLYASALYAAINSAKNGTTFAVCRNESSNYISGALETINKAFNTVGVSTLLSFAASEANGYATAEKIVTENADYMLHNQAVMGIAASYLASNDLFANVSQICSERGRGVIINTAEDSIDQANTMRDHKRSTVTRIYESGLMDYSSSILVNANYLDDNERSLINNKPSWITHNPCANFQRGIVPFNSEWINKNIMLGSDFTGESIARNMRTAYFHSLQTDNKISPREAFDRMNAVHNYISTNNFEGDGDNNLVVFANNSPMQLCPENFVKHLTYNFDKSDISLVISDGRIIVKDGITTLVDENEALKICAEQIKRIR